MMTTTNDTNTDERPVIDLSDDDAPALSTLIEDEQGYSERGEDQTEALPPGWEDVPALATVEEMAELLRTTKKTVYNLLEDNDVPGARKVGRSWRVSVEAFRDWYESGSE